MLSKPRRPIGGSEVDGHGETDGTGHAADERGQQPGSRRQGERAGQHRLLTHGAAQARGDGVAGHRRQRRHADGDGEPRRPRRLVTQPERQVEEHEPDGSAQQHHRHGGELDTDRVQLHTLGRLFGTGGDDVGRQSGRARQGEGEQGARVEQRPPALDRRHLEDRCRDDGHEPGEPGDHAELGVGLDEVGLRPHDRRDEGLLGDEVRLLQHQRREDEREQGQLVDRHRHQHGEHDPRRGDDLDDRAPAAGRPVDGRTDERGEEQERREADQEEQQHAGAGRAGVDAEEQRVRQGDEHRRVAAHHRRVGDAQPAELGHLGANRAIPPSGRESCRNPGRIAPSSRDASRATPVRTCSRARGS